MDIKNLEFNYLGAPISPTRPNAHTLHPLKIKIINKIKNWHAHNLSFPGRITLIKSVLNSIPIHTMRSLLLPDSFILDIQSILSSFLWSSKKAKSVHWIAWDQVTLPYSQGGLNIKSTSPFYFALASKHTSNLLDTLSLNPPLWCTLLRHKYNFKLGPPPPHLPSHSPTMSLMQSTYAMIKHQYHFTIDKGSSVSIWFDPWIWDSIPLIAIPSFFPNHLISDSPVSILFSDEGHWIAQSCHDNLPPHIASWIFTTHPTLPPQYTFTVKDCYRHLLSSSITSVQPHLSKDKLFILKIAKKVPSTQRALSFV